MLPARILPPLLLILSAFRVDCLAAANPPTADDVNTLSALARLATDNFYQQTFEIRMRYEFAQGFFSDQDRLSLYSSAAKSARHLADIIVQLEEVLRRVEQYQGADWDQRFGSTGLYEKASNYLSGTKLSRFGIDYYRVLSAENKKTEGEKLLLQINAFTQGQNPSYLQLVKGKILALLAQTDSSYTPAAEKLLTELRQSLDTDQRPALLAAIEQIQLKSGQKYDDADRLARDVLDSTLKDDLEIILPLAFVQRTLGRTDSYNNLLQSNSPARSLAADITLVWLEAGNKPANPLDAALAAEAALRNDPQKHKQLLLELAGENTSASPVIDYAAAVTVADCNEPQAVYLLIRASKLLDEQSAQVLQLSADQIAAHAAKLAYRAFVKQPNQCELAADAFETYFDLAGQSADPNLQYTYTQVLTLCGHYQQAVDILRKIPPAAEHLYPKAQLDLIIAEIASGPLPSIFDRAQYAPMFSRYLRDSADCIYLEQITMLLQSYLKEIELLEADRTVYLNTVMHSKKTAKFLYDCIQDKTRASILAEFTALDPNTPEQELAAADELLSPAGEKDSDGNMLRACARLVERRCDFAEAARLWEQVAQLNEAADQNLPSWQWWRAKYYQLQSAAKAGGSGAEIAHAIDVLQNTYKDVPTPWAARLESLARSRAR